MVNSEQLTAMVDALYDDPTVKIRVIGAYLLNLVVASERGITKPEFVETLEQAGGAEKISGGGANSLAEVLWQAHLVSQAPPVEATKWIEVPVEAPEVEAVMSGFSTFHIAL